MTIAHASIIIRTANRELEAMPSTTNVWIRRKSLKYFSSTSPMAAMRMMLNSPTSTINAYQGVMWRLKWTIA